jgi:hypothetical protein
MTQTGYVYALSGTAADLRAQAERTLGTECWHWVANVAAFCMGNGVPESLEDQGAVYSERGELRWWRREEGYEALLLVDGPVAGLTPMGGEWHTFAATLLLPNLDDRRYAPSFTHYPSGSSVGRVAARVYQDAAGTVLVSLRTLLPLAGKD